MIEMFCTAISCNDVNYPQLISWRYHPYLSAFSDNFMGLKPIVDFNFL